MLRYPKANPSQPASEYIIGVKLEKFRYHTAVGDMWPLTWGNDNNIYGGAGDNRGSGMNFWRISGEPEQGIERHSHDWTADIIDDFPVDPLVLFRKHPIPGVNRTRGVKPAGLLDIDGTLYFAIETQNYGEDPEFTRQRNLTGFIISTRDYGKTWNREVTPVDFFTGRLSSCHFLQFGMGYRGSRDNYVYAYFPVGDDGNSYWENGDGMLLGRVPLDVETRGTNLFAILRNKDDLLIRKSWEFCSSLDNGQPTWDRDDTKAIQVFRYPGMTGENHVSYNPGIGRYLMGNYSFIDDHLNPRPWHQKMPDEIESSAGMRSQLTLFEAPEPWGPWKLFYRDDNWGTYGDYQPCFPTKWMYDGGKTMFMVSSGSADDYNFVVQEVKLTLAENKG